MANLQVISPALAATATDPQPLQSGDSSPKQKHILAGFFIVTAILSVGAFLYFCFKKKLYVNCIFPRKRIDAHEKIAERRFNLEELQKATNNFSQDCLLGSGAFGNVYKGTFNAERILAIKKAHSDPYTSTEEFKNEVRLLSKVKHNNLVKLVGFCEESEPKGAKILIYEYVSNGSLLDYITGRGGKSLTWRQRVNIAIGAAKGIAHLHEGIEPCIIHRDLKPSNILVGEGFEAKVSDFGLVKLGPSGDKSHVSSQIKGTPGYLDPAYCSSFHLTTFSDVYSFGVILLQLVAARPAIKSTKGHPNTHIIEWARPSIEQGKIEEILDANLPLESCNMGMMLKMAQLGLRCVVKVPRQRPTMTQVWQELEAALYSAENFSNKQPTKSPGIGAYGRSMDSGSHPLLHHDISQSFVSIDDIKLQKFHIEMDNLSFQSASLRCFEVNSICIDIDDENNLKQASKEKNTSMYEDISTQQH